MVEPVNFVVKVDHDGDIRRFQGTEPVRFEHILELATDAWPEALAADACLKYEDEEGDLCTLTAITINDLVQMQAPDGVPLRTLKLKLVRPLGAPTGTVDHEPAPSPPVGKALLAKSNEAASEEQAEAGQASPTVAWQLPRLPLPFWALEHQRPVMIGCLVLAVVMAYLVRGASRPQFPQHEPQVPHTRATCTFPAPPPAGYLVAPMRVDQPLKIQLFGATVSAMPLHWYFRVCWKESATVSACVWQAYLFPWIPGMQIRLKMPTSVDMRLMWNAEVASQTDDGHFTIGLNASYATDFGGVLAMHSSDPTAAIQQLYTALKVEARVKT